MSRIAVVPYSEVTCPHCSATELEIMPTDACQAFYASPKPGDRCVFCSYGGVKCPPIQRERGCLCAT